MYKIIQHPHGIKFIEFYNRNNFHVILSNYGASIYQIDTIDRRGQLESVTLSPIMVYYFNNPRNYGLTIGRVAGRIPKARFKIDNVDYKSLPNEHDNLLHSGEGNVGHKFFDFTIADSDEITMVTFIIKIKDMEDGFPGNMELRVEYSLSKLIDEIDVRFLAISDKDTLMNLTNHSYFNLSGNLKSTIENEVLKMNMNKVGVMNDDLILDHLENVTPELDFRSGMAIKTHLYDPIIQHTIIRGYDHIYHGDSPLHLELFDPVSGRVLTIDSDYHDCVIYTNNFPSTTSFPDSIIDKAYLGIAIEPERYTNILKPDGFLLKANALYNHEIRYQFSIKEEATNASENH